MNILSCFKIVPDIDSINMDFFTEDDLMNQLDYVRKVINCFDETALELSIRLKEKNDDMRISALTIGGVKADSFLKKLYALGYDQAVRVETDAKDKRAEDKADIIAGYLADKPQDIVFVGKYSSDMSENKLGYILSEKTGYRCIDDIAAVEIEGHRTFVSYRENNLLITKEIKEPSIMIIGNSLLYYLRVPTLKDKMKSKNRQIEVYKEDIHEAEPETVRFTVNNTCRTPEIIEGEDMHKVADIIYKEYIEEEGLL